MVHLVDFMPRKEVLRWRREFPRFLEIIKCSAALFQFQRENKEGVILANEQDYEIAKEIIGKISSSSGIEGLTSREKRAYETIKKYYKENQHGCTRNEIHAFDPIYSDRGWEKVLDRLAQKNLLALKLEENPDTKRKATYYYPVELVDLPFPDSQTLKEQMELMEQHSHNNKQEVEE